MMNETEFLIAFNSASGAYKAETGGGSLAPWGYSHEKTWQDAATGFKARAYSDGEGNYILAFAGTEDFQDAYQDLANFGMAQWNAEGPFILEFFQDIKNDLDKELNSIQFTGHSLGGALAQYAAYDFVIGGIIGSDNAALTTFNALGGVLALDEKYVLYKPDLLVNANIHHYFDPSDLVSMLSPHLGGQTTNYQLRASTDPIFTFDAHTMSQIQSYLANGTLRTDLQASHDYFEIDKLAEALQIWGENMVGWTENNHEVSDSEAAARIISMASIIPYVSQSNQWGELKKFLIDNIVRTSLAPKFGITSEIGIESLKFSMDIAIQSVGKSISKAVPQLILQGGAQLTIFISEAYEFLSGGPELDPAEKALTYSLLNYIAGSTLSVDENGHFDERVNENVALKIFQMAHIDDRSTFPKLVQDIGRLIGQNISENFEDAITLVNRIVEDGIVLADFMVSADSYTQERLLNLVHEESAIPSIPVDALDARLVRYSIINRLPFILEDVRTEFIDPSILYGQRYALTEDSDQYWAHRLEFFHQTLHLNSAGQIAIFDESEHKYFRDYQGGQLLVGKNTFGQGGSNTLQVSDVSNIRFGSESNDINIGGYSKDDFLYGRGGDDTLFGEGGGDHLEGNTGNDTLHGGTENDYLYGGVGEDHLHGDEGNDFLYGGDGSDTYYYVNDETQFGGHDAISDIDAGDRLNINGTTITTLTRISADELIYQDEQKNTYILGEHGGLTVNVTNSLSQTGTLSIEHFDKDTNNFGITLNEAAKLKPPFTKYIVGSIELEADFYSRILAGQGYINDLAIKFEATSATGVGQYDGAGAFKFDGGNRADNLIGGMFIDQLNGLAGDDYIKGLEGDDFLNGGVGSDTLLGGEGNDFIAGNNMDKAPYGDSSLYLEESELSQDFIVGGEGDDTLSGDEGNDTVFGGSGKDSIAGGQGADILAGGSEDDNIFGDSDRKSGSHSLSRSFSTIVSYIDSSDAVHSYADIIDGGEGNDHLLGEIGDDTIQGGDGDDWIMGDRHGKAEDLLVDGEIDPGFVVLDTTLHGDDMLFGGAGIDTIAGNGGDDFIDGGADNDFIWGDDQDIEGSAHGKDTLLGGTGDDQIIGGGQDDVLHGGDGQDVLIGDEDVHDGETTIALDGSFHGKDELHGGKDNDTLIGGGLEDRLFGDAGNDVIYGDSLFESGALATHGDREVPYSLDNDAYTLEATFHGDDYIDGGAGDDTLYGGGGKDIISGGSGSDLLFGQESDDILNGGAGQDNLIGGTGNDTLTGGKDDDYLIGGAGNNTYIYNRGDGIDRIELTAGAYEMIQVSGGISESETIILRQGNDLRIVWGTLENIHIAGFFASGSASSLKEIRFADGSVWSHEDILERSKLGSDYDQTLMASEEGSTLYALGGDDHIIGGAGNDTFIGGWDNDTLQAGAGENLYYFEVGDGQDTIVINPTATSNTLILSGGIQKSDVYIERNGDHFTLKFNESTDQIFIADFFKDGNPAYALTSIIFSNGLVLDYQALVAESKNGGPFRDFMNGTGSADVLYSYGGNDEIRGGAGDDNLSGGEGDDTLYGDEDNDALLGEAGADQLHGGTGEDMLSGGMDNDLLYGGDQNDELYGGEGNDKLYGGDGNDILSGGGNTSENSLYADQLYGEAGDDTYLIKSEGGWTLIYDYEGQSTVQFGDDIALQDLSLKIDSYWDNSDLVFQWGDSNVLSVSYSNISYPGSPDLLLSFEDGQSFTTEELIAQIAQQSNGTPINIEGGNHNDIILGTHVNDQMLGGWGDDVLNGLAGDDILLGEGGHNTYQFAKGGGQDTVITSYYYNESNSIIEFTDIQDVAELRVERYGTDLKFAIRETGDAITIKDLYASISSIQPLHVSWLKLADGSLISLDSVHALMQTITEADDFYIADEHANTVDGLGGNDQIYGLDGADKLRGGAGDDILYGGAGDDTLTGSIGNDVLVGGEGEDTYVFNLGDGHDVIEHDGIDTIIFGEGIHYADLTIEGDYSEKALGAMRLFYSATDSIYIDKFGPGSLPATIVFTDLGSTRGSVTGEQLLAFIGSTIYGKDIDVAHPDQQWMIDGSSPSLDAYRSSADGHYSDTIYGGTANERIDANWGDDTVFGGAGNDEIYGGVGSDNLYGESGDDRLYGEGGRLYYDPYPNGDYFEGGIGNDQLYGWEYNDSYHFNQGDGQDLVEDKGGNDQITFSDEVLLENVSYTKKNTTLLVHYGDSDVFEIANFFRFENETWGLGIGAVENFLFSNGSISALAILDQAIVNNERPILVDAIDDIEIAQDNSTVLALSRYFVDRDGDRLNYSVEMEDGTSLPDWIQLNGAALTFSPVNGQIGTFDLHVTASDGQVSTSAIFSVSASDVNDAPVLVESLLDIQVPEDQLMSFTLPADAFHDVDQGDRLTIIAKQSDGSDLPSWLSFNPDTLTFSGTPSHGQLGELNLTLSAMDINGSSISDNFTLRVVGASAPVIDQGISDVYLEQTDAISFELPLDAFLDEDGDPLSYSVTMADGSSLPSWLNFDGLAFTGSPRTEDIGLYPLQVIASDGFKTATSYFNLSITGQNNAPVLSQALNDIEVTEGLAISAPALTGHFSDQDIGDSITYSALQTDGSTIPDWLHIDETNGQLSGTPAEGDAGVYGVVIMATDQAGTIARDTLTLRVNDVYGENPLSGTAGDDVSEGTIENDYFVISPGKDAFNGAGGSDTVQFGVGSGQDSLSLPLDRLNTVTLEINGKLSAQDISFQQHGNDLLILINDTADLMKVKDYFQAGNSNAALFSLRFNNQDVLDEQQINALISTENPNLIFGDSAANSIEGTADDDRIYGADSGHHLIGGDGNDQLFGGLDNDRLDGGAGDDLLAGGKGYDNLYGNGGNNRYLFNAGDVYAGIISDSKTSGRFDTLVFGEGIWEDDISLMRYNYDLILSIKGTSDSVSLLDFYWQNNQEFSLDAVEFSDGTTWSQQDLINKLDTAPNRPPSLNYGNLHVYNAYEDNVYSFTITNHGFYDLDDDPLTFSLEGAYQSALPTWLNFDPDTLRLYGTPTNEDVGPIDLKLIASDGQASASRNFSFYVGETNDAPVRVDSLDDISITKDLPFNLTVPETLFSDEDSGDTLTYSATKADGNDLPDWLLFNSQTRTFSGTPTVDDVGTLNVNIIASDRFGETAIDTFHITVRNENTAPILNQELENIAIDEGADFSFTIPGNTFEDLDGDALTYTVKRLDGANLPAWLSINGLMLSGTPTNADVGSILLEVVASDGQLGYSATVFELTVNNVNDAPVLTQRHSDFSLDAGNSLNLTLAENMFIDVDQNDSLRYTATLADGSPLPSWITFNPLSGIFSGIPGNDESGTLNIMITANDQSGATQSDTFLLTINPVEGQNVAPQIGQGLADISSPEDSPCSVSIPMDAFSDSDGDELSYTATLADGSELPGWLDFDGLTFTGTPTNADVGLIQIRVSASDGEAIATDVFGLEVTNVNDEPVVIGESVSLAEESTLTIDVLANDSDIDGDSLSVNSAVALNGNVVINPDSSLDYTPNANFHGTDTISYEVSDGQGGSASSAVSITVTPENDDPVALVDSASTSEETEVEINILTNDSDIDGDSLTVTMASADNGSVSINPNGTLSYTPDTDFVGSDVIIYTLEDGHGGQSQSTVSVTVTASNDDPVANGEMASLAEDSTININVLANDSDADGDNLSVATASAHNGNVHINADGTLNYTPNANFHGSDTITYDVSDGQGGVASASVNVVVNPENDIPVALADTASTQESTSVIIDVLANDSDIDGDHLTIASASVQNGVVVINADQSISYTPNANFFGSDTLVYEVADGLGGLASSAVTIEVSAINTAPSITLTGTSGHDTLTAGEGDDILIGLRGSDIMDGGAGNDTFLIEGFGNHWDTIQGGTGYDQILGGTGDDEMGFTQFDASHGIELIDGHTGINTIRGSYQHQIYDFSATTLLNIDAVYGEGGHDTLIGSQGNDTMVGGSGSDLMDGQAGDDRFLIEGFGNHWDIIQGGTGFDQILGGRGDDEMGFTRFEVNDSIELIDGRAGINVIRGNYRQQTYDFSATTLLNIDAIYGEGGNDTLIGSQGNDTLVGGSGNDVMDGQAGDDRFLIEGFGNHRDTIQGGSGFDQILGGAGNDAMSFKFFDASHSIEVIDGGAGFNSIQGSYLSEAYDFSATTLINIDAINGDGGNDTLIGSQGSDFIVGGTGHDFMSGQAGNDRFLIEGVGNGLDIIHGGSGLDQVIGGAGDDEIGFAHFDASHSIEVIDGGAGSNKIRGNYLGQTYDFSQTTLLNIYEIDGDGGDDVLIGSSGNDILNGNAGNDLLEGGDGNDILIGGAGHDRFIAGLGADTIISQKSSVSERDTLELFGSQTIYDLWFTRLNNDLEMHVLGQDVQIRIQDWFTSDLDKIDVINNGSHFLEKDSVDMLVNAMAGFGTPSEGSLNLTPAEQEQVSNTIAVAWH